MKRQIGDTVMVYEDIFSKEKPEGEAKLVELLGTTHGDLAEMWLVEFPDGSKVNRIIALEHVKAVSEEKEDVAPRLKLVKQLVWSDEADDWVEKERDKAMISNKEVVELQKIPKEEAILKIKSYIEAHAGCRTSDVILDLGLDPDLVLDVLQELEKDKEIRGNDFGFSKETTKQ